MRRGNQKGKVGSIPTLAPISPLAQLEERFYDTEEVSSSILLWTTIFRVRWYALFFGSTTPRGSLRIGRAKHIERGEKVSETVNPLRPRLMRQ